MYLVAVSYVVSHPKDKANKSSPYDGSVNRAGFWWTYHPVLWVPGNILVSGHPWRNLTWCHHITSSRDTPQYRGKWNSSSDRLSTTFDI